MINNVVLVGRLTRDPELRQTTSNISVSQFTIAVNRNFQNAQGQIEADFINCVAWRQAAENLCKYMQKGSLIGIEGRIQTRNYDDQSGKKVYVTEVVCENIRFLESKKQNDNSSYNQNQYQNQGNSYNQNQGNPFEQSNQNNYNQNNNYGSQIQSNPFETRNYEEPIKSDNNPNLNPFKSSIDIDLDDDLPF